MARQDPKVSLFERIEPEAMERGFKLIRSRGAFERKRGEVTDNYILSFLSSTKGARVQPGLTMRYEPLDRIYHQISGAKPADRVYHAAISLAIWRIWGGREKYEFLLTGDDAVDEVVGKVLDTLREIALPFFDSHSTVADVDRLFNENPNSPESRLYNLNNWTRCAYATIAARLVGNPRYPELVQADAEFLARDYGEQYQALLRLLDTEVPGPGA